MWIVTPNGKSFGTKCTAQFRHYEPNESWAAGQTAPPTDLSAHNCQHRRKSGRAKSITYLSSISSATNRTLSGEWGGIFESAHFSHRQIDKSPNSLFLWTLALLSPYLLVGTSAATIGDVCVFLAQARDGSSNGLNWDRGRDWERKDWTLNRVHCID